MILEYWRQIASRTAAGLEVAVWLLGFILGYSASPDPAGDLADTISEARQSMSLWGGSLTVVASICGTDRDPHGLERQQAVLEQAGAIVFPSNTQAARFCTQPIQAPEGAYHGTQTKLTDGLATCGHQSRGARFWRGAGSAGSIRFLRHLVSASRGRPGDDRICRAC